MKAEDWSTAKENLAIVHRYWERCWNLHDTASLDDTHHLTFAQNGEVIGTEAFKKSLEGFFASFPDVRISIEDIMVDGDKVLMRVTYSGTHLGTYQGVAPTGRTIRLGGLELFLLVGGRIVQHWHEMDHIKIFEQINSGIQSTERVMS